MTALLSLPLLTGEKTATFLKRCERCGGSDVAHRSLSHECSISEKPNNSAPIRLEIAGMCRSLFRRSLHMVDTGTHLDRYSVNAVVRDADITAISMSGDAAVSLLLQQAGQFTYVICGSPAVCCGWTVRKRLPSAYLPSRVLGELTAVARLNSGCGSGGRWKFTDMSTAIIRWFST